MTELLTNQAEPISTLDRDRTTSGATPRPGLLALLALAQLIIALDYNIVFIALPDMARGLEFSAHSLQWVVSGYAVAFGGFLLLGGRACDLLQRRAVFIGGLGVYAVASLVGGFAIAPWMLIAARAAQGLGGAMLFPATLSLLNSTFAEGRERNRALSVWGAAGATGMIVGSLAGGVLTQAFGWRAVFFVNVPLAAFAMIAALRLIDASPPQRTAKRFDLPGAMTATLGTTLAVLAIVQGPESGWTSPGVLTPAAGGTALLVAFALIERRSDEPLVPSQLLANRNLSTGTLVAFLFMATMGSILYFLTVYFQAIQGYSPLRTGIAFLVPMTATCLGSSLAGRAATRFGIRRTLLASLALAAIGAVLIGAAIAPHGSYGTLIPGLVIFGFGQGMTYTLMFAAATTGVAAHDQGVASGIASTAQQIGGAVGLAVLIGIANAGTAGTAGAAATAAATDGIRAAILVAAVGVGLAMLAAVRFSRPVRNPGLGSADQR